MLAVTTDFNPPELTTDNVGCSMSWDVGGVRSASSPHREERHDKVCVAHGRQRHRAHRQINLDDLFDGANPFDEAESGEQTSEARQNRPAVVKDKLEAQEAQNTEHEPE